MGIFIPIINTPLMKLKLVIVALVIFGFSACTQKTCPTYAKTDVEKPQTEKAAEV